MTRIAMVAVAGLLAAVSTPCSARPPPAGVGSASYRAVADSGLAHCQLWRWAGSPPAPRRSCTPKLRAPPAYPLSMPATCPALVELPARVIVGPDGRVGEVHTTAAPAQQPFAMAVRRATQAWRYTPLTVTCWAVDAAGNSHPVGGLTRPFSLDCVFTFRCAHGHATAEAPRAPAAEPPLWTPRRHVPA